MRLVNFFCFLFCVQLCLLAATKVANACSPLSKRRGQKSGCYSFTFRSRSLDRKIEGNVWIPSEYDPRATRLPYAIFLHGRHGDRDMLTAVAGGPTATPHVEDTLSSLSRPFLVFAVSGGDHYWVNAARSKERWGDLITTDLVQYIERHFHVIRGDAKARAIFGISMGAAGVMQLGFHAPGLFAIAAAMSPVIRRETEIGKPGSVSTEPPEDYDSFGEGASFHERNPHDLCEKNRRADGTCLPFQSFRLDAGEADDLIARYSDSRAFIEELKRTHPSFSISIGHCVSPHPKCTTPGQCNGHSYDYWGCLLPIELRWISAQFAEKLKNRVANQ